MLMIRSAASLTQRRQNHRHYDPSTMDPIDAYKGIGVSGPSGINFSTAPLPLLFRPNDSRPSMPCCLFTRSANMLRGLRTTLNLHAASESSRPKTLFTERKNQRPPSSRFYGLVSIPEAKPRLGTIPVEGGCSWLAPMTRREPNRQ